MFLKIMSKIDKDKMRICFKPEKGQCQWSCACKNRGITYKCKFCESYLEMPHKYKYKMHNDCFNIMINLIKN